MPMTIKRAMACYGEGKAHRDRCEQAAASNSESDMPPLEIPYPPKSSELHWYVRGWTELDRHKK
jgi:hypothetical protein